MTAGLAFAFGAGLLAAVSLCALSILRACLSHYLADADGASSRPTIARLVDGLVGGAAVTAGFAVAALSCMLAVLLAVLGQALATGSPVAMLAVLAAYAAGSATVIVALSVSAAITSGVVARGLRRLAAVSERISGALLIAAGVYLLVYWLPVIAGSVPDRRVISLTDGLSVWLTDALTTHRLVRAAVTAGLVIAGATVVLARRPPRPAGRVDDVNVSERNDNVQV